MRVAIVAAALALAACTPARSPAMSDTNQHAVRRLFEDGFNHQRTDVIEAVVAPEYVDATGTRGPAAFAQVIARLHAAFPDIRYELDAVVADATQVAVRWHWTGTHRGPFRGVAPTERAVTNSGAAIFQVRAGQITAASLETDRLGFLQAIGVVAPDAQLFPPSPSTTR